MLRNSSFERNCSSGSWGPMWENWRVLWNDESNMYGKFAFEWSGGWRNYILGLIDALTISQRDKKPVADTVYLLLGRGAGNGGGERVSHLFTPYDFYDVRCYLSTNVGRLFGFVWLSFWCLLCSAFTQWHLNALPLLSQMHHPGQAVSLPQEVASAISNHLPQSGRRAWKITLKEDGVLSLLLGMFFKPTDHHHHQQNNQPPTFLIPSYPFPSPESALPIIHRPSLSVIHDEFSQLPCKVPLSAPLPRLKNREADRLSPKSYSS